MIGSTVRHPALLGRPRAWEREVARLGAAARQPGLFEVARIATAGPDGNTATEQEAIRAFVLLGQAFGLDEDALAEWHRVFAYGELPQPDGALMLCHGHLLGDLLLRVLTLATYQDRAGQGASWMAVWRRSKPLRLARQAMSECPVAFRDELMGPVDPRIRRLSAESPPSGARAVFWQCRARLLAALLRPVEQHVDGDDTTLVALGGVVRVEIQRARCRLHWTVRAAESAAFLLGEMLETRHWVSDWVDHAYPGLRPRLSRVFIRLLQRDGTVARLLERAREAVRCHASLPHAAMAIAEAAYELVGVHDLPACCYTWAWRNSRLYLEVHWAAGLVEILPLVHRSQRESLGFRGLRDVRAWLRQHGLTAAGWRWLVRNCLPGANALEATEDSQPVERWLWLASVYGAIDKDFPSDEQFSLALLAVWTNAAADRCPIDQFARLVDAGWQAYRSGEAQRDVFLRHSFIPVCCWALRERPSFDSNQWRAGWRAIARAWHAAGAPLPEWGGYRLAWPVPTRGLAHKGLVADPIDNLQDLIVEGDAMHNCLAEFAVAAQAETFAVYSVRTEIGRRIANFSLHRDSADEPWEPHDCLGWANDPVSDERVHALARLALVFANRGSPDWDA